jgi:hypothetical protein
MLHPVGLLWKFHRIHFVILHFSNVYRSYVRSKASGMSLLLLDGIESMCLAVNNFVVMMVNPFQIDFSHIFNILYDIKVKRITAVYLNITS